MFAVVDVRVPVVYYFLSMESKVIEEDRGNRTKLTVDSHGIWLQCEELIEGQWIVIHDEARLDFSHEAFDRIWATVMAWRERQ